MRASLWLPTTLLGAAVFALTRWLIRRANGGLDSERTTICKGHLLTWTLLQA
jgi:hypothetical protein